LPDDFRQVISMLEQDRFPTRAAISTVVPLEKTPEILRDWSADPGRFTKVMVSLDQ
jgi:threonine dehydrogenase-like Zn-dependent dehydrogenase